MEYVFFVVEIHRGSQVGEPMFVRPEVWDPIEIDQNSLPGFVMDGGMISAGEDKELELRLVKKHVADKYIAARPDRFWTLTEKEADALVETAATRGNWPDVTVSDANRVIATHAKVVLVDLASRGKLPTGVIPPVLTQQDMNVLDPDSDESGVNRLSRKFRKIIRLPMDFPVTEPVRTEETTPGERL